MCISKKESEKNQIFRFSAVSPKFNLAFFTKIFNSSFLTYSLREMRFAARLTTP